MLSSSLFDVYIAEWTNGRAVGWKGKREAQVKTEDVRSLQPDGHLVLTGSAGTLSRLVVDPFIFYQLFLL